MKTIVAYGGGTNSTAMLVGMFEKGILPGAIVFADTGGEKTHTYKHIEDVSNWCLSVGFPKIEIVRGAAPQMVIDGSLEGECLRLGVMPSKAYGFSTCSLKWKIEPQRKFYRKYAESNGITIADLTVFVGFDADEQSRVNRGIAAYKFGDYKQEFPLFEWGWGREECVDSISRAGITQPGKSACFFCPSTKKAEILELRQQYPALLNRALEIERRAMVDGGKNGVFAGKGLGRSFNWGDFLSEWDKTEEAEREFLKRQLDFFSPEQCDACVG